MVPMTQSGRSSLEQTLTGFVLDLQLGFHLCKMNQSATKNSRKHRKLMFREDVGDVLRNEPIKQ
jgi:hypothetical protein